ncbi:Zn(2)-C6 fungal-type domain-containing protein [Mycena venus]|uniref:Zn(2)-C6 fungal-type domain-containing protein n=1 Tax=Mycena venus TaxID=2733690 RepID=A0A8H7CCJ6_9AGAR|nr:Zn(2)-C6 fungal-type domain-containing protein [Mycena venus]
MSSGYGNTSQQWSQYPRVNLEQRLQLEHEYDFSALSSQPQHQQGFADSYQFSPDAFQPGRTQQFTASPPSQSVPLQQQNHGSRSSSYTRTGHSTSPSIDQGLYNQQQNFGVHSGFQNSAFLTTDPPREYHNNAATYNFQAATSPTPLTATGLSAITTSVANPNPASSSSYYPSRPAQPSKAKRQRVPEPTGGSNEQKDDDMDGEMEEEGGARAKPPGACARCKNLKVKCEFKTETDPCKRCFNGGHDCVTPGRKKRRTPPKREHLLNQIREQAAEIQKLMTQLEQTKAPHGKPPNSAVTDSFPLTPSSGGLHSPLESENNRAVEDWIAKARDSLAEFDGFIGIGGAGMPKSMLVKEDLEDSASSGDEDDGYGAGAEHASPENSDDHSTKEEQVEIEVLDSEGEEVTHRGRRNGKKLRQLSIASTSTNGRTAPKKRDSGGEKLATLPSEASPFGLMADLSLKSAAKKVRGDESPDDDGMDDNSNANLGRGPALGVANSNFFRSSPTPDPMRSRPLGGTGPAAAPHILTRGLITPQEAEKLFDIYFQRMNLSVSLLDPVLYTPQKTCYRSPFLFTVVCAIASRFYTERPELYPQAMHFAQLAAGTALISGHKCVELCQGYILMSLYPVPAKRWEEERGWLYLGLAIRMAIDLNLHLPNTAQPLNESHAREMLNRTRVWLNCFNLDRSTGSQYGKAPTISNSDYMANHSWDWWRSSPYNMQNFDIHICAYNSELKVMAAFMAKIYSDPHHPTGLNKNIDFEAVASETDEELKQLEDKWRKVLEQTDMADPQNRFRSGLLKLAFSYARLVALSFGFQHAFGKNNTDENPFLNRCVAAASDVVKAIMEDVGRPDQRIYLRHGPIAQSVFVTFAASMLVKLLQPKFASYLTIDKRQEIRGLVKQVIDLLASPDVSIDDKHGPNLYARFLKGASSRRRSQRATPSNGGPHTSPETNHSLSPPPTTAALSFDRFAPPLNAGVDPFMPLAVGGEGNMLGLDADSSPPDFFPPSLPYTQEPLQGMQSLTAGWPDADFSWMSQIPNQDYMNMRTEGIYSQAY